jgi:hypothetical protein
VIRTLTFVFVLALLGGAAVGFFAKDALVRNVAPAPFSRAADPKIDKRLEAYRDIYHLDDAALRDLRAAHEEYYRAIDDIVRVRVAQLLQEIEAAPLDDPVNPRSRDRRRLDELSRRFLDRVDRVLPEWARTAPGARRDETR